MAPNASQMTSQIRYVSNRLKDGWLMVKPESGPNVSIPSYLKVSVYKEEPDRSYFVVLEGVHKGKRMSVTRAGASPNRIQGIVHSPAGIVRLNRTQQKLWYGSNGPYFAFSGTWGTYTAIKHGRYTLQIPEAPHLSNRYGGFTSFQNTWFLIMGNGVGPKDGRYLHVGELSDGCVTVRAFVLDPKATTQPPNFTDWANVPDSNLGGFGYPYPPTPAPLASWTDIYNYLINSRLSDQSVGTLVVE